MSLKTLLLEGYAPVSEDHLALAPEVSEHREASQRSTLVTSDSDPRYQLRTNKRDFEQFYGCWLDADESGNFDPTAKSPSKSEASGKKVRLHFNPSKTRSASTQPHAIPTLQAARQQGLTLPVTLQLKSKISDIVWETENGKAVKLRLADPSEHFWPEERPYHDKTELAVCDIQPRRLRTRPGAFGTAATLSNSDQRNCKALTLGHPEYRGCKACYDTGIDCTLVKGEKYPCDNCVVEDEDCELVAEPIQKRACGSCIRRRLRCSFINNEQQRGSCDQCRLKMSKCVAGPKSGYTRVGPCLKEILQYITH